MKVSNFSLPQTLLYAGILTLTVPAIAQAAPFKGGSDQTVYTIAQASAGTFKTYKSPLGFRFEFPSSYNLDTSQEAKGTIVLQTSESKPTAEGSDEPAPVDSNVQSQSSPGDKITVTEFPNPQRLSAQQWAEQNKDKSFFDGRQSDYRAYSFAGQPAVSYSWCGNNSCGDSVIVPSRDRTRVFVLSALYEYPGNAVRWDFKNMIGRFRLTQ
ncbi:MAG: hypothetical protein MUC48_20305 [Leptolyngbya sp. Prado105]|jgi:hypothetical protein|nr:hypothetical protein [Leptolyngbya sp. Prado105]